MPCILLIDIGSTFTKITAIDIRKKVVLGCANASTTLQTDVNEGLDNAVKKTAAAAGANCD
ncbi:MAG: glutamate mutase L [Firmicutes bacterium]|nr:glutamate mutase L [Bacillota bacterium]